MKRLTFFQLLAVLIVGAVSACGPVEGSVRDGDSSAGPSSTDDAGEREERLAAGSMPKPAAVAADSGVLSLDDFTRSSFCRAYRCAVEKSWELQEGGVNHTFGIPGKDGILIEVEVDGGRVVSAGLFFVAWAQDASGRRGLPADDQSLADAFVRTLVGHECAEAERLIRANATRAHESMEQAPSARCGAWTVRAAQLMSSLITLKRSE
jgi:hypothetical protein